MKNQSKGKFSQNLSGAKCCKGSDTAFLIRTYERRDEAEKWIQGIQNGATNVSRSSESFSKMLFYCESRTMRLSSRLEKHRMKTR